MDKNDKAIFKWKFYRLTVELNIIVLFVALSIPVFLLIQSPYAIPVIIVMLALALILSLDFIKNYQETKAWLDECAEKDHKEEHES